MSFLSYPVTQRTALNNTDRPQKENSNVKRKPEMKKNNSCGPVCPKSWLTITPLNNGKLYKMTPSVSIFGA